MPALDGSDIERVFREEYGRAVACPGQGFGDIDLAEEAGSRTLSPVAAERWPSIGLPPSPAGWIISNWLGNRAADRPFPPRGSPARTGTRQAALLLESRGEPAEEGPVRDDVLQPDLHLLPPGTVAANAQVAGHRRCGCWGSVITTEIARAFLAPEATMAQRLGRQVKGKIQGCEDPVSGPWRIRAARSPAGGAGRQRLSDLQRGLYGEARERLVRDDLFGAGGHLQPSVASWRTCCPTEPGGDVMGLARVDAAHRIAPGSAYER